MKQQPHSFQAEIQKANALKEQQRLQEVLKQQEEERAKAQKKLAEEQAKAAEKASNGPITAEKTTNAAKNQTDDCDDTNRELIEKGKLHMLLKTWRLSTKISCNLRKHCLQK